MDIYSPLRLTSYQVTTLALDVDPDNVKKNREGSLGLDFDVRQNREKPDEFLLELTVGLNGNDEQFEKCGFRVLFKVRGFFDVANVAGGEEERGHLLLVNGLSMLYGIARTSISEMTSQSPTGRLIIPTVNMQAYLMDYTERLQASEERDSDTATA